MYMIDSDFDDGVLVIRVTGTIANGDQATEKAMKVIDLGVEAKAARVLLDERALSISVDVLEIIHVAEALEERGVQSYGGRMACLFNPDFRDIYRVYETAYKNRSMNYRLFEDTDRAMVWLKE